MSLIIFIDTGDVINDNDKYFSYNFSSLKNIFISLMYLQTLSNFPDIMLNNHKSYSFMAPLLSLYVFFTYFIIQSVLIGSIEEQFMHIWMQDLEGIQEYNEVLGDLNGLENYQNIDIDMEMVEKRIMRK